MTIKEHPCRFPVALSTKVTLHVPAAESRHSGLYVLLLFRFYLFLFTDFCQTSYLKIYRTDLHTPVQGA